MQDVLYNLVARHPLITFNMITTARKHLDEVEELQNDVFILQGKDKEPLVLTKEMEVKDE